MVFEHFAINVPDARGHADWLCQHLDMRVASALTEAPFTRFLADAQGRVVLELYSNPTDEYPDYAAQHVLRFHFAFAVDDPASWKQRVLDAGATLESDTIAPDGSHIVVVRDPWGVPIQLIRRAVAYATA